MDHRRCRIKEFGGEELSKWLSHFENLLAHDDSKDFLPDNIVADLSANNRKAAEMDVTSLKRSLMGSLNLNEKISFDESPDDCCDSLKEDIECMSEIAQGTFGTIYKMSDCNGQSLACKQVKKNNSSNFVFDNTLQLATEIICLETLSSAPSSINLISYHEEQEYVELIMPFCEGGDLCTKLSEKSKFSEPEAAKICASVSQYLKYAHEKRIMHRDLKLENILLKSNDSDTDVCVIDLGLATFFEPNQKFTEMVGTVPYMSPNMILGRYGHQTDYWSLGVILCLLLTGSEPFEGENDEELKKNIVCKKLNLIFEADPWKSISVEAKDLLCGLLEKKEDKRFSADDVLSHPWIQQHVGL